MTVKKMAGCSGVDLLAAAHLLRAVVSPLIALLVVKKVSIFRVLSIPHVLRVLAFSFSERSANLGSYESKLDRDKTWRRVAAIRRDSRDDEPKRRDRDKPGDV